MTNKYSLKGTEKLYTIKNWLGRGVLQSIQTLTKTKQEACRRERSFYKIFSEQFRPQHNKMILYFQYYKLSRLCKETTGEWMGRLRIKAAKFKYIEDDRCCKDKFINGINDK